MTMVANNYLNEGRPEEVDETVNPTADMVQEESSEKFLETINRINF